MLEFAAILPHPPILISEIGKKEQSKIKATKSAVIKIISLLKKVDFDTLVVISPHGLIGRETIPVLAASKFIGTFGAFGAPSLKLSFKGDLKLAEQVIIEAGNFGIGVQLSDRNLLDYGTLVPLYFVKKARIDTKILPIGISYASKQSLFAFGQALGSAAGTLKRKIAVIASGDLSHRLRKNSPGGYRETAKLFDTTIVAAVKRFKPKDILEIDSVLAEEAGECGLRPISILLGVINGASRKGQVLSYEAPFGVGYLVANFELKKVQKK